MLINKENERENFSFSNKEFQYYSNLRIIKRNLVHFLGFPDNLLDEKILSSKEYFGQFGNIIKIMINSKYDEISRKKCNSAYITFSNNEEAAYAILTVDSIIIEGNIVRAFFGTTKYCIHFLNNIECYNKEKCIFLHNFANENDIIGKNYKFNYSDHIKLAKRIINYGSFENKNYIMNLNIPFKTILPNVKNIYLKDEIYSDDSKETLSSSSSGNYIYNFKDKNLNDLKKNLCIYNFKLFKYKDKSRFFNSENNNYENNIPQKIKDIIDELSIRFSFFKKFEDIISFKTLENDFCQAKLQTNNDLSLFIYNYF